jgi:hypothetical protein
MREIGFFGNMDEDKNPLLGKAPSAANIDRAPRQWPTNEPAHVKDTANLQMVGFRRKVLVQSETVRQL